MARLSENSQKQVAFTTPARSRAREELLWLALLLTLTILLPLSSAVGQTLIFCATDDAYISHGSPDHNTGTEQMLIIRNDYGCCPSPGWAADGLIKFDLSQYANQTITSAKLKLYYDSFHDSNPTGRVLKLFRNTADWNELTVTWNNQPGHAAQPTSSCAVPAITETWMDWNVTTDVQAMVQGSIPNYGWHLLDDNYWGTVNIPYIRFRSTEYDTTYCPRLEITVGPVHPPEDTCVYPGKLACIPIYLDSLPPWDVSSVQMVMHYDESVLHAAYATSEKGIAELWSEPTYNIGAGQITIAMAGSTPLADTGVLVWVCFEVVGDIDDTTLLTFESDHIILNDSIFAARGWIIRVCGAHYEICGRVRYCLNDHPVKDARIMVSGGMNDTVYTDAEGIYKFIHLPAGLDYVMRGDKIDDAQGVISAFDASLILRHTVGLLNLSPCQMIAGDVTGNCWVNAYDASLILKYVVGQISQFPIGKDWKFIPATFPFDSLNWCVAPDSVWYDSLSEYLCYEDWKGILYGDLSGNWGNLYFAEGSQQLDVLTKLVVKDIQVNPGEEFVVPIQVENISEVYAVELGLNYDNSLLSLTNVKLGELSQGCYLEKSLTEGEIKLALAGASSIQGSGNMVYLTFKVLPQAQEGITTQLQMSRFCLNEACSGGSVFNINIGASKVSHPLEFSLFQNNPNPFNPQTEIGFFVPSACWVQIKIYNVAGQLVKVYQGDYPAGTHTISWDATNLKGENVGSGIYFYRMEADSFVQQKKMVLIR